MDSLPPTLRWDCLESGFLKLPPESRAESLTRKPDSWRRAQREVVGLSSTKSLSDKFKEAMRKKQQETSRQEALALAGPVARTIRAVCKKR